MHRLSFPYLPILYFLLALTACTRYLYSRDLKMHHIIGLVITFLSFALWIISRMQLGKAFSLKPRANFLVISGIYSKLRHPVYVFSVLALVGLTIFFLNKWLLAITFFVLILELWRRSKEEKVLLAKFGKKYKDYQKSSWF
jgi:protein-S-isoprenylcysteine O-methyltransferase Ste14